jgi:hypothetical protein
MIKLFSNGCSFLTPRPKNNVDTFVTKHIAEKYKMDLQNIAMGGRGNTRISFSTKVWFEQNGGDNTFAIIGWSSGHRNDYVTNDGWKAGRIANTDLTWRTWKTLDNVSFIRKQQGWAIDENATMNFLDNVFDLQNYFERKRIPFVMYNALPNTFDTSLRDFQVIKDSINMERFFNPNISHYEYVLQHNLTCDPADPHPSTKGHVDWAEQLMEYIDANNLRTIK